MRELQSGAGDAALPEDVEVTYARLLPGGEEVALAPSGEHLFSGDRVVVRCRNTTSEARFVSVLDVGLSGTVAIMTASEPDGVTLAAKETYEVGRSAGGALEGIDVYWPPAVPGDGPRPETMITIVADEKVTGLGRLEQAGITARTRSAEAKSDLEQLVEDLGAGRRDARPPTSAAKPTRYRVHRLRLPLPSDGAPGRGRPSPPFEIEERPDPSFRLVVPRAAARTGAGGGAAEGADGAQQPLVPRRRRPSRRAGGDGARRGERQALPGRHPAVRPRQGR